MRSVTLRARSAQEAEAAKVASPCIDVCRIHEKSGYCEGCRRTLEEIASWSAYGATEKRAVLARLPARRKPL